MVSMGKSNIPPMDQPFFDNPNEAVSYWKHIAEDYVQKLQDVRDEFDEFQVGSHELESELEVQLEQYEQKVSELVNAKQKLEEENHIIKEKLETLQRDTYIQVAELQDENLKIKTVRDEMQKYIRELEQCNDDLERSKRATICSLEEFDVRLNNAIERNAFLENELEEKEQLIITVQRLKDESRDLKGELASSLKESTSSLNGSKSRLEDTQIHTVDTNSIANNGEVNISPKIADAKESNKITKTDFIHKQTSPQNTSNQMSPSSRISALNIVSDLLRKVGALESKLARCRNFVRDHPESANVSLHILSDTASNPDKPPILNAGSVLRDKTSNTSLS